MTDIPQKLAELAALLDRGLLTREEFEEQKVRLLSEARRDSDGSAGPVDAGRLRPGVLVGNYQVIERIGQGGMATVYKVRHRSLDSTHALKVLDPSLGRDEGIRDRFLSEGKIQANLRHPNIIRVTDLLAEPGVAGLVAEFIEGADMGTWIAEHGGTTDLDRIRQVFIPIAEALATAHEAGVVHRDVKPSNILLTELPTGGLHPTVVDFGIAKVSGDGPGRRRLATKTGAQLGTVDYMSPEQVRGARDLDGRTDVFGLAATLHEFVTGSPPFRGDTDFEVMTSIARGMQRSIADSAPGLAPGVVMAVDLGLQVDRRQRLASCREFARSLGAEVAEEPRVHARPPQVPEAAVSQQKREAAGFTFDDARALAKAAISMVLIIALLTWISLC